MGALERTKTKKRLILAASLAALFLLNLALYAPLFSPQQRPYKGSIAAGYAGITRFIAEHPNPWGWNPQQYLGQPTQFTYPPLIPYTAALLHWLTGMEPFWAYRTITALLACLGPVTLALGFYWLTGSPSWALLLGTAYTLLSPLYALFELIDRDRGLYYLPWRLLVLMKYGEGPHLAGLTMLPMLLAAIVWGARRRDFPSLLLMALALASAPLTNWLCAFALTILVLILLLSDWRLAPRTLVAGLLGYGLSCFWLTPEYVAITLFNWPKDAYGYKADQAHWPLYVGLAITLICIRLLMGWLRATWELRFLTLSAAAFFWITGAFYFRLLDTIPESRRYSLEFELFLMAALAAWLRLGWHSRELVDRTCAILCVGVLAAVSVGQIAESAKRRWTDWGIVDREQTLEFKLSQWLVSQKPRGRIFATGGLRFRLNAWSPLPQIGGTFESGLRNRVAVDFYYQVRTGEGSTPEREGLDALRELTILGAEHVAVHSLESEEYYKDFKNPQKFQGLAPIAFQATPHDWIHHLPFSSLAHLVQPKELPTNQYLDTLPPLYAAIVDPERPKLAWIEEHPGRYRIEGPVRPGDEIFASMNFDPGWRAYQDGVAAPVKANPLGLMQIEVKPRAKTLVVLDYAGTSQQKAFAALSATVWIVSMALWCRSRWRSRLRTPATT